MNAANQTSITAPIDGCDCGPDCPGADGRGMHRQGVARKVSGVEVFAGLQFRSIARDRKSCVTIARGIIKGTKRVVFVVEQRADGSWGSVGWFSEARY